MSSHMQADWSVPGRGSAVGFRPWPDMATSGQESEVSIAVFKTEVLEWRRVEADAGKD